MEKPAEQSQGLTFVPVPAFSDLEIAFGARETHYFDRDKLPDVPREFERCVNDLFFKGGRLPDLAPDIDTKAAMRAVRALLGSFAPAHEAKIATVAYALWVWTTPQADRASC